MTNILDMELYPSRIQTDEGDVLEFDVYVSYHAEDRSWERNVDVYMALDTIRTAVGKSEDLLFLPEGKEIIIRDYHNDISVVLVVGVEYDLPYFIIKTVLHKATGLKVRKYQEHVVLKRYHHKSFELYYKTLF